MTSRNVENVDQERPGFSRRDFLKLSGNATLGAGVGVFLPNLIWLGKAITATPVSGGYLLVDVKKCQGCLSCMLACSLVHEGKESLSLSRIQVLQNPFIGFPEDIKLAQCRQCVEPACIEACPTGALYADARHGNIRMVNQKKCTGCRSCIEACPYKPSRAVWNFEKGLAQKCDLCTDTPFWKEQGGPSGKQACVQVCPLGAIIFTDKIPVQKGDQGYLANLRGEKWQKLGYPID
jgi:protein NrfC